MPGPMGTRAATSGRAVDRWVFGKAEGCFNGTVFVHGYVTVSLQGTLQMNSDSTRSSEKIRIKKVHMSCVANAKMPAVQKQ